MMPAACSSLRPVRSLDAMAAAEGSMSAAQRQGKGVGCSLLRPLCHASAPLRCSLPRSNSKLPRNSKRSCNLKSKVASLSIAAAAAAAAGGADTSDAFSWPSTDRHVDRERRASATWRSREEASSRSPASASSSLSSSLEVADDNGSSSSSKGSVPAVGEGSKRPICSSMWLRLVKSLPHIVKISLALLLLLHPLRSSASVGSLSLSAAAPPATASSVSLRELLTSGWTGLVAGCLHTLTGPDHLAALAPLTIGRSRVESAAIGALWGCGHDAGQVLFGILFVLLKDKLHIEVLRVWGSRIVGLTMLAIGGLGIQEANAMEAEGDAVVGGHSHPHAPLVPGLGEEGGGGVLVADGAGGSGAAASAEKKVATFGIATFIMGIVHGLQPDALLVVLPALAFPSRLAGASFLVMFLIGTIVAMGSYTAFIGSCSTALKKRIPGLTRRLSWGAGAMAIAFGVAILLGEVFGFSLF